MNMVSKRLTMKGLMVSHWLDRQTEFEMEVDGYYWAGKLKNRETVANGIGKAVSTFIGLFEGRNAGKMVVELN
jgi:NADPH-dependent curcumin reductase CurA